MFSDWLSDLLMVECVASGIIDEKETKENNQQKFGMNSGNSSYAYLVVMK